MSEVETLRRALARVLMMCVADRDYCTCQRGGFVRGVLGWRVSETVDLCPHCEAMIALGFERGWENPNAAAASLRTIREGA